ncbi:glycosyltransferase family A protein [Hirschia litorea]|uniref:Glycosyltransferase family A protein n=1 Tax=Hirschia litorea TaxID=1199156 RepID=A0ABW2IFV6_9PROT
MPTPLVAIVTPIYNGEEFLAEMLESVQAQTYPNLVHVILENNSTDKTLEIIESYSNGRVPILLHKNEVTLPRMENWNRAFELAPTDAEYVRLLCADDTITPDCIDEMVKVGEMDPEIGVIGCLHSCAGEIQDFFWDKNRNVFDGLEANRMTLLRQGVIMPVQMMMRQKFVRMRTPLFQGPLTGGFDLDTKMNLLTYSKFGFVHKSLGMTRVHENTVSAVEYGPKTRSWTSDGLYLMNKYGPAAFGTDYDAASKQFINYYIRRIMSWKKSDGGTQNLQRHFDALQDVGLSFNWSSKTKAMFDWILIKLGIRRNWTGYPGWQ